MHHNIYSSTIYKSHDLDIYIRQRYIQIQAHTHTHTHTHTQTHTHTGILSPIKKNEIMPFAETLMDLEITVLSEIYYTK